VQYQVKLVQNKITIILLCVVFTFIEDSHLTPKGRGGTYLFPDFPDGLPVRRCAWVVQSTLISEGYSLNLTTIECPSRVRNGPSATPSGRSAVGGEADVFRQKADIGQ
jgi:hypothetical protein